MKPLTIELANGFALELCDQVSNANCLTGRIAARLRMPAQPGRFTRDLIMTTYAYPDDCRSFCLADGDPWTVQIGGTFVDLDTADQAHQVGYWISTYETTYAQQRAARLEGIAA